MTATILPLRSGNPSQPPRVTERGLEWRYLGQPMIDWPGWVRDCCSLVEDGDDRWLCHKSPVGAQAVHIGEWLVLDFDETVYCGGP